MAVDVLGGAAVVGSEVLYNLLVNRQLTQHASSETEGEKPLTSAQRKKLLKDIGAHKDTPIIFAPKGADDYGQGSGYLDPDTAKEVMAAAPHIGKLIFGKKHKPAIEHGAIITGRKANPAILAHEAGHAADIQQNKRSRWPYALGKLIAPLAGGIGGYYLGAQHGPLAGMGLGTLGTLALGSPVLWQEYQASRRADEALGKDKKRNPWKRRSRLGAAFGTYLGAMAVPALAGGAIGAWRGGHFD
jgi:hypothetical protein